MIPGAVTSVTSLNGFQIEIFFSTAMVADATFFDPANYVLTDVFGAAPSTALSVVVGTTDANGATSAIVTHTGTTLGGRYDVTVNLVKSYTGVPLSPPDNTVTSVLMKGEPPDYSVTPTAGDMLEIQFDTDMLTEAEFTPGIEDTSAYFFDTTYPVPIVINSITHPTSGDASLVTLDVTGMTSASYDLIISPADAIIYDGTLLPSAATTFTGTEIGTGTSTIGAGNLLLTKLPGSGYGWNFTDTSGKILPGSSYRCEITVDVPSASFDPPLFDTTMATFDISDGAIQATLTLTRVGGSDFLDVTSGAFSISIPTNWSTQSSYKFGLVRNQKADTFTIMVDDCPVASALTAAFTGAAVISGGAEFILDPLGAYEVMLFPIQELNFTSSQTVFSQAWNFLHSQSDAFVGDDAITSDVLKVSCGPLVKGWGDATPATKQDVVVYVNGTPVDVAAVNPYLGLIQTAIPIPLTPPGVTTVTVDYIWFPSPVMEHVGYNTLGLVYNKYDINPGNNTVFSSGSMLPGGGSTEGECFPFAVVYGPADPRKPLYISHRYEGFEKAYTAAYNSPTTLLYNRSNHTVALPDQEIPGEGVAFTFEGTIDPLFADPPWELLGTNADANLDPDINEQLVESGLPAEFPDGIFPVQDSSTGSYSIGQPTLYSREFDVDLPETILVIPRMVVDANSEIQPLVPDGVFTGVGFGAHNNQHLFLVGMLLVNDVQHVGMLTDPGRPEKIESWALASSAEIRVESSTTFTMQESDLPPFVREEVICALLPRFQILDGSQAGVYQLVQLIDNTDGTVTATVASDNPFPADPSLLGNAFFTIYFELLWDGDGNLTRPTTYRLLIASDIKDIPDGFAQLFIGGSLTGLALTLEGAPPFAIPPDSTLMLPTSDRGQVFWGSVSRKAQSRSLWNFIRYGTEPAATTFHFRGIVVAAEMNDLPEDDPNNIWFVTQGFGYSEIDASADALLLKSTSDSLQPGVEGVDLTFAYARVEAFFDKTQVIDVDARFRVESGTISSGDAHIVVRDTEREIRLATLTYEETAMERRLVENLPSVSLSGLLLPEMQVTEDDDGWEKTGSLTTEQVQGQVIQYEQEIGETLTYTVNFSDYFADPLPNDGRILEQRLKVETLTTTEVTGDTGIFWACDAGDPGVSRGVGVKLRVPVGGNPARVVLFDFDSGADVATFDFDWQDEAEHTYRTLIDPDTDSVSMVIDDTIVGTVAFVANFTITPTDDLITYGFSSTLTSCFVELCSFSVVVTPPSTVKRTLGVWLGGDLSDIDNWEIPRTDALAVSNSNLAAVVEEMDWTSTIQLRIHRDPTWGVTILRPDLPPPPFFTGDFATQITEPSAGWINVEYRYLPQLNNPLLQDTLITQLTSGTPYLGFVGFGALDSRSVTQQRWEEVRYRIFEYPSEDLIAPHHMVYNQYNVITSGEFHNDVTIEQATVTSINTFTISLKVTNIWAGRIFNLQYNDQDGNLVVVQPSDFEFDYDSQTVTLINGNSFRPLPQTDAELNPDLDTNPEDESDALSGTFLPPDPPQDADIIDVPGVDPSTVHIPVTVQYAPGKPITTTYLESQPLLDGTTLLNEGTPPVPKSRVCETEAVVEFGSKVNDPTDTYNDDPDFIFNDPYRFVGFERTPEGALYENIEFLEVDNGGLTGQLASICDDQSKLVGVREFALEGLGFTEVEKIGVSDGTPGQSPNGPAAQQVPFQFMAWSGGSVQTNGNLNQGLWGPPPPVPPGPGLPLLDGNVEMGVIGTLYDTVTMTTTILYFDKQVPYP